MEAEVNEALALGRVEDCLPSGREDMGLDDGQIGSNTFQVRESAGTDHVPEGLVTVLFFQIQRPVTRRTRPEITSLSVRHRTLALFELRGL